MFDTLKGGIAETIADAYDFVAHGRRVEIVDTPPPSLRKLRLSVDELILRGYEWGVNGRKVRIVYDKQEPKLLPFLFDKMNTEFGLGLEHYLHQDTSGLVRRFPIPDYEIDLRQIILARPKGYAANIRNKLTST